MRHDSEKSEKVAGYYHLGFALLYVIAMVFHLSGARDHFRELNKENRCHIQ